MFAGGGGVKGSGGGGGDDDMYDYDYSVDLNSSAAPGTAFGYNKLPPGTSLGAQPGPGRMMTGQAGRMMTGQASRMGTSSGGPGDLRPMTSVSGAGYQVRALRMNCPRPRPPTIKSSAANWASRGGARPSNPSINVGRLRRWPKRPTTALRTARGRWRSR